MDAEQVKKMMIREAVKELWLKIIDMNRGEQSLSEQDWHEVIRQLDQRLKWLESVEG